MSFSSFKNNKLIFENFRKFVNERADSHRTGFWFLARKSLAKINTLVTPLSSNLVITILGKNMLPINEFTWQTSVDILVLLEDQKMSEVSVKDAPRLLKN